MTARHSLRAENLVVGYGDKVIIDQLSLHIPPARISVIVGPNACGKSTLLRSMSRVLLPQSGQVLLDGKAVHSTPPRQLAQTLGLLPQSPIAPEGITVADLISRGRHPHHGWITRWKHEDEDAITQAMGASGTSHLADRMVDELSGGQRQRVWIALALAQQTDVLLLDEPTTFLDVGHQIEVLDLLVDLNRQRGTTVVMVLHDLNMAARYGDHLIAMKDGAVFATGTPDEVITEPIIGAVFGIKSHVLPDPTTGRPMMLPIGRHLAA